MDNVGYMTDSRSIRVPFSKDENITRIAVLEALLTDNKVLKTIQMHIRINIIKNKIKIDTWNNCMNRIRWLNPFNQVSTTSSYTQIQS